MYRGRPRPPAAPIPEGATEVRITGWRELDSGDFLVFLSDENSRETAYWVPEDIEPREDNKTDWLFWRLVGAFDFPNENYWEADHEGRPEQDWDHEAIFTEIKKSGRTAGVNIVHEYFKGEKRAAVKGMWSPRRKKDEEEKTKDFDNEVPF